MYSGKRKPRISSDDHSDAFEHLKRFCRQIMNSRLYRLPDITLCKLVAKCDRMGVILQNNGCYLVR